ncbi:hypothetical protein Aduo_011109 [Ancylostoma duodenale]
MFPSAGTSPPGTSPIAYAVVMTIGQKIPGTVNGLDSHPGQQGSSNKPFAIDTLVPYPHPGMNCWIVP